MSFQSQATLTVDGRFVERSTAAAMSQATNQFTDHLADEIKRGNGDVILAFVRLNAAGPGIADKVDNGDGTIDQAKVTDADLLSLTQANWPTVAALYPDGSTPP